MTPPGPPVALDDLLAHRAWVRRLALALARDEHDAADVEQSVWADALRTRPAHGGSIRGWLATAVRRAAWKLDRSRARREAAEAAIPRNVGAEARDAADAAELAEQADAHRRVVEALVALDEPYRRTLLLRYFEGLAVAEVAARTGAPLETTRARLRRGIAKLRTQLEGEFGGREAFVVALGWLAQGRNGTGATAAGIAGGAAMAGAKTAAAAVAVLAILAGAAWWARGNGSGSATARSGTVVAGGTGVVRESARAGSVEPLPLAAAHRDRARAAPPDAAGAASPAADAPVADPLPATARARLDRTKMGGQWSGNSLLEMLGEVAGTADVDVVVPETEMASARAIQINLSMSAVSTAQVLRIVCTLSGLTYTIRDEQVIVHARGAEPAADAKLVAVERASFPPAVEQTLRFRVLRDDGAPAAGAALVVPRTAPGDETVLARAADDGTASFTMRPPFPAVVARLAGNVESEEAAFDTRRGAEGVVEMRLRGAAGRLVGLVSCDGRPVAGAIVRLETDTSADATEGKQRAADIVHVLIAGADGRFEDLCAPPQRVRLWVRAAGCVADSRTIDVVAGAESRTDFALAREAVVEGRITRDGGAPVKGATVSALTPPSTTAPYSVTTDEDGAFVLRGVPGGRVRLSAHVGSEAPRFDAWIDVPAGGRARWDAAIDGGLRLTGRVTAPKGTMVAGWSVRTLTEEIEPVGVAYATCDATGAFDLRCTSRDARRLAVYSSASPIAVKVADPAAVVAAGSVIDVAASELPSAFVRIDVALAAGDSAKRWRVEIDAPATGDRGQVAVPKAGGETRSWRMPPGRYRVRLVATTGDAIDLGEHDLAAGETKDLGTVALPAPR